MTRAYVALGANLGDPVATIEAAFAALAELPQTTLAKRSALYRTAPVGLTDQPEFINAAAALDTALDAETLLTELLAIERRFGRERGQRNGPRTLDLDVLLHGDTVCATPHLTLPHPRMPGFRALANPIKLDGERLPLSTAPALGAHPEEVLAGLGYDAAGITALREAGAL